MEFNFHLYVINSDGKTHNGHIHWWSPSFINHWLGIIQCNHYRGNPYVWFCSCKLQVDRSGINQGVCVLEYIIPIHYHCMTHNYIVTMHNSSWPTFLDRQVCISQIFGGDWTCFRCLSKANIWFDSDFLFTYLHFLFASVLPSLLILVQFCLDKQDFRRSLLYLPIKHICSVRSIWFVTVHLEISFDSVNNTQYMTLLYTQL